MITNGKTFDIDQHGQELKLHGSAGFPCGCYAGDLYYYSFPFHWHDELEFVTCIAGTFDCIVAGRRVTLAEGDALFVNARVPHAEESSVDHCAEGSLVCHPRLLSGGDELDIWRRYLRRLVGAEGPQYAALRANGASWEREAAALVREAHRAVAREEEFFEVTAREHLTRVCMLVLRHVAQGRSERRGASYGRSLDNLGKMVRYIEEHSTEDVTTTQIAAAAHVSPRQAQREFSEQTGLSPTGYLQRHRLLEAARLLRSTSVDVGEVSTRCGFSSQSYFTRCFKEHYGLTPTQYRAV